MKTMLIEKTLELIGQKGSVDVSVRDITDAAKVNVSAINYHFKGKKNLFNEIEQFIKDGNNKIYENFKNPDKTEGLINWSDDVIKSVTRTPGILIVVQYLIDSNSDSDVISRAYYKKMDEKLDEMLMYSLGNENYQFKKNVFLSSLIFPSTRLSGSVSGLEGLNTYSSAKRRQYVIDLINLLKK